MDFPAWGHSNEDYDTLPTPQLDAPYGTDETSAFAWQTQLPGGQVVTTPNHSLHPTQLLTWEFDLAHSGAVLADTSLPADANADGPSRKRKAATLHAEDWEPYKKRILDLHIEQNRSLPEVRQMIEEEYGFKAGLRQYRSRISQWGKDKNVKTQEMQAIVRKRQKRKLVETDKGQLIFDVRGTKVDPQKIERWMKRHDVVDSALYAPSPAAPTPSDVGCYTISERSSPAMTTVSMHSPVASGPLPDTVYIMAQRSQMSSPALSISSIVRPQTSAFAGQSPALTPRSLPKLQLSFVFSPDGSGSARDGSAKTRYREDEEKRLRDHLIIAEFSFISNSSETLDMLFRLGTVLIDQGRYKAAENAIRRLVDSHRRRLSHCDDDRAMLGALTLLGQALLHQGIYVKAEKLFRRVLQGKNMLTHEDSIVNVSSLGWVLERQGKYDEAEAMHRQSLEAAEKLLEPNHPYTIASASNLGSTLKNKEKYKDAEVVFTKTLVLWEEVFGSEHPHTLLNMSDLAGVRNSQGRHKEAEEMFKTTLELQAKVLGPEHPDTLRSMTDFAEVLAGQSRYKEAEEMYKETLVLHKKILGHEHPRTLTSMNNLAVTLWKDGMYGDAEDLQRETLALQIKVLGPGHPTSLRSMDNLAAVLHHQGMHEEAEALRREVAARKGA